MPRLSLIAFVAALLAPVTLLSADSPAPAASSFVYTRIQADADGGSRFTEGRLTLQRNDSPLSVASLGKPESATLAMLPPGAFEDWHPAPRRLFLIVVQGISEVGTTDGKTRRFPPGSVVLMEDTTGKGHTTRVIGNEQHIAVMIPLAD